MIKTALPSLSCISPQGHLQVTQLDGSFCLPGKASPANGRDVFVLLLVVSGSGSCTMNRTKMMLQDNNIYAGYASCFQEINMGEGTQGYCLCIHPQRIGIGIGFETIDTIGEDLSLINDLCIQLDAEVAGDLCWITSRLLNHTQKGNLYNPRLANKYLTLLLLLIRTQSDTGITYIPTNRKSILLKNFFCLLEKNFSIHKTVDHYAALLCVSAKYLTNVIKSESGYPTSYHINQRIILEAIKMVKHSGASMKVVAYALGFEDMAAFSKLFKRITGINFKEYKYNLKIEVRHMREKEVES